MLRVHSDARARDRLVAAADQTAAQTSGGVNEGAAALWREEEGLSAGGLLCRHEVRYFRCGGVAGGDRAGGGRRRVAFSASWPHAFPQM